MIIKINIFVLIIIIWRNGTVDGFTASAGARKGFFTLTSTANYEMYGRDARNTAA